MFAISSKVLNLSMLTQLNNNTLAQARDARKICKQNMCKMVKAHECKNY